MIKRKMIYRDRVVDAVAAWHARQFPGKRIMATEVVKSIREMAHMPDTGSGPSVVASLLITRHGWERDGRSLWLPPRTPKVVAKVIASDDGMVI
jgi:hypothetical protein